MPLFKIKKQIFHWIKNGQKTIDIRKGRAYKGDRVVFQCGPFLLKMQIIKKKEGKLVKILRPDNYKAVVPIANSVEEAINFLKRLYGETEGVFTAYYLQPIDDSKKG